jgi:uncharacterized protein
VTSISASLLYNHLQCPHRVFMDSFADPALRDPVSPFVQMLWERGTIFEKETETRAAIGRGDTLIYSGRLSVWTITRTIALPCAFY